MGATKTPVTTTNKKKGKSKLRKYCCISCIVILGVVLLEAVYMGAGLAECMAPVRDVEVVDTATLVRRITAAADAHNSSAPAADALCVHQTWRSEDLTGLAHNSAPVWTATFGCHALHTDAALDALFADAATPAALRRAAAAYPSAVQRADVARVALLHRAGGVYADLDAFPRPPCRTLAAALQRFPAALQTAVVPRGGGGVATNHFLLGPAKSAFLAHVLARFPVQQRRWRAVPLPYLRVFLTTGPCALTAALRTWARAWRARGVVPAPGVVLLADPDRLVAHYAGRTWLAADGRAFNWIGDHPHLAAEYASVLLLALTAVAVVFCVARYCRRQRRSRLSQSPLGESGACDGEKGDPSRAAVTPPSRCRHSNNSEEDIDSEEMHQVVFAD